MWKGLVLYQDGFWIHLRLCNYSEGEPIAQAPDFLRLAAPLRYAARRKGTWDITCPWVSLAPEALASPTAKLLPPLTRLPSYE